MKTAIFDVDGTLVNTHDGIIHTIREVLEDLDLSYSGDYDLWIGPPVKKSFMEFCGLDENRADEATHLYRKKYVEKYITESYLYPGMIVTMDELKNRGVRLAVATMKTKPQVDKLFSYLGIADYFDVIRTARDDGSLSKAQMVADIMGSNDAYMIGDTNGDKEAAEKALCHFIGITYGFGFKPDEKYNFLKADRPEDIVKIILGGLHNV